MLRYTLSQLADLTAAKLVGDPAHEIDGVEQLDAASSSHAAFLENPRYEKMLLESLAGVVFVNPAQKIAPGKNYLVHPHPSFAFQKVIELFIKETETSFKGIHSTAVIHPTAKIGTGVSIGPYTVIDQNVIIKDNSVIGASCYIGSMVEIGESCTLHAHVTIRERCILKNRVVIQPGAVIGSCGFGYHTNEKGVHTPLRQLGCVVLEDDVEIGANTTIDRARFKTTLIKKGTKIDNLVQIAHGVEVGEHNLIVSQVGIAGSTKTGRNVIIGGQVGVNGHITLADQSIFAARSAISKSIEKPGIYSGTPAVPIKECNEMHVHMKNLSKMAGKLKELEKRLAELEAKKLS